MKRFEVQVKHYCFYKKTRKLQCSAKWIKHKRYMTMASAKDAVRDFRNSKYDEWYRNYPPDENKFPHITPVINIYRYRIIEV